MTISRTLSPPVPPDYVARRSDLQGVSLLMSVEKKAPYLFFEPGYQDSSPMLVFKDGTEALKVDGKISGIYPSVASTLEHGLNVTLKPIKVRALGRTI